MNEAQEFCKFCGRALNDLELYERCPCSLDDIDKDADDKFDYEDDHD